MFDLSLKSSIVVFPFTSVGSKDFRMKLQSLISYISGNAVYPVVDVAIRFMSSIFSNWL